MFPGWTAEQLFQPATSDLIFANGQAQGATPAAGAQSPGRRSSPPRHSACAPSSNRRLPPASTSSSTSPASPAKPCTAPSRPRLTTTSAWASSSPPHGHDPAAAARYEVRSIRLTCLRGRGQHAAVFLASGCPGRSRRPMPLATLPGDRLGRLESTARYPAGRPPLTARYRGTALVRLRRHNALLDAEVTAPPGPGAAVFSGEHDRPGADPGPCCSRDRSQRLAPAPRKARR